MKLEITGDFGIEKGWGQRTKLTIDTDWLNPDQELQAAILKLSKKRTEYLHLGTISLEPGSGDQVEKLLKCQAANITSDLPLSGKHIDIIQLIPYDEAVKLNPKAAEEAMWDLRESGSKLNSEPPEFYDWFVARGVIAAGLHPMNGKETYRIAGKKNQGRCEIFGRSNLYDNITHEVVPGNWSF